MPIVLLTARGMPEDRIRGLSIGADDYVAKPFEPEELALRINAILRRTVAHRGEAPELVQLRPVRIQRRARRILATGRRCG